MEVLYCYYYLFSQDFTGWCDSSAPRKEKGVVKGGKENRGRQGTKEVAPERKNSGAIGAIVEMRRMEID